MDDKMTGSTLRALAAHLLTMATKLDSGELEHVRGSAELSTELADSAEMLDRAGRNIHTDPARYVVQLKADVEFATWVRSDAPWLEFGGPEYLEIPAFLRKGTD